MTGNDGMINLQGAYIRFSIQPVLYSSGRGRGIGILALKIKDVLALKQGI